MIDDINRKIQETYKRSQRIKQETFYTLWDYVEDCSSILKEINPTKRKMWLQDVLDDLYEEQNGKCAICGGQLDSEYHVDHKIPFSKGGGNERSNLQLAHPKCNQSKGNAVDIIELLNYLEDIYMNLPDHKKILLSQS